MIETKFKDSTYGLIPYDWKECRFEDVLQTFSSGATPYRGIPSNFQGTIRWITSGELNYNHIYDTIEHISEDALKNTHLRLHPKGTFLMAITGLEAAGTRGRCAFVGSPSATNQSCLAINSTDKMIVEYLFWFYCYWSDFLAFRYSQGSKQQSFTANIVRNLPIYLPPTLDEQQRIAEALSDVDALISSLSKMIEKKRNIKLATMQQLLTGKKRLAGFREPWIEKKLGEVATVIMGQSPSSSFYNIKGYGLPLIQGNADIGENRKQIVRYYTSMITKTCQSNTIIMSVRAPVGSIGKSITKSCLGRGVCAINYENDFIYHFLVYFESQWGQFSKGSTFDSINGDEVRDLPINMPLSLSEQIAIANVLTDMDNEIAQLEARKKKYEAIKQGMMQKLLTGKIRLV